MHKLTSKRQVTMPLAVCEALGLNPGDYVEIFERDGVAHLVKVNRDSLAGAFSSLAGDKAVPDDTAIKRALRERAAAKFGA